MVFDLAISLNHCIHRRQTRVYNNEEKQCGPVYVTVGDGGNREGLALK